MLDFVAILATIMLIKAQEGGLGKRANAAAEHFYLEVMEKQGSWLTEAFSPTPLWQGREGEVIAP